MKNKNHKSLFLKPWIFLILAVASGYFSVYQLRLNNEHMSTLRDAVYEADKSNGDVKGALQDLQAYVTRHMNTNLQSGPNSVYPPIQLKYTYDRLAKAQNEKAQAENNKIYTDAQHHCESLNSVDFSGRNRVPCIQKYVASHTTKGSKSVPDELYKFAFASPRWSPDLAGWSMVFAFANAFLFVVSFIYHRIKSHHWL